MDIDTLLDQARESRGNAVIQCQVALVKARGEHKKLGGEEDYKSSLVAIVNSYGTTGVKYSLVREVLYDTEELNAAVKELVDAKKITKSEGKRDFLLTTTKVLVNQPQPDHSDENPGAEPSGPTQTAPLPVQPSKGNSKDAASTK